MAINVYSLGTAAALRVAGDPAISYTFTVPADFPLGTVIQYKVRLASYSISAADSAGNAYLLSGSDTFTPTGTYHALHAGDTITLTLTPTAGGAGYFIVAGYAVTGSDFQVYNGAAAVSGSGTTASIAWGPLDYAASLTAAGKTARAAAYVAEFTYDAGYSSLGGTGVPPVTMSITGEPAHTGLNDVSIHTVAGTAFQDSVEGLWHSFRIYSSGRGNGESGTVGGSSNYPNPSIGNLNGIAYYADTSTHTGNPWAHHPPFRGFRGLYAKDGDIKGRSAFASGPLTLGAEFSVTGGTTDSEPALVDGTHQGIGERLVLLFTRNDTDVYLSYSDGDGEPGTWSTPTLMFSGCKHPDINYDRTSKTFFYLAREISTGHLKGSIQGPGDAAPITAFTLTDDSGTALVVDDDTARVSPAEDGPRRWRMAVMISGAYTVWKCTDDGSSWKQEI